MIVETAFAALLSVQPLPTQLTSQIERPSLVQSEVGHLPLIVAEKITRPPRHINRPPPFERSRQGGQGRKGKVSAAGDKGNIACCGNGGGPDGPYPGRKQWER